MNTNYDKDLDIYRNYKNDLKEKLKTIFLKQLEIEKEKKLMLVKKIMLTNADNEKHLVVGMHEEYCAKLRIVQETLIALKAPSDEEILNNLNHDVMAKIYVFDKYDKELMQIEKISQVFYYCQTLFNPYADIENRSKEADDKMFEIFGITREQATAIYDLQEKISYLALAARKSIDKELTFKR